MGILLMIVGYGWALIGAGNLVMAPWETMGSGWGVASLMFNGLLFILPGLGVGALGQVLRRRQAEAD